MNDEAASPRLAAVPATVPGGRDETEHPLPAELVLSMLAPRYLALLLRPPQEHLFERLYVHEGWSTYRIAIPLGLHHNTVGRILRRRGVSLRHSAPQPRTRGLRGVLTLRERRQRVYVLYATELRSCLQIEELLGIAELTVRSDLTAARCEIRSTAEQLRLEAALHMKDMTVSDDGHPLRVARYAAGVSQPELARRTGLSVALISAIENGKRIPLVGTARILAIDGLGLPLPQVFGQPQRCECRPGCPELTLDQYAYACTQRLNGERRVAEQKARVDEIKHRDGSLTANEVAAAADCVPDTVRTLRQQGVAQATLPPGLTGIGIPYLYPKDEPEKVKAALEERRKRRLAAMRAGWWKWLIELWAEGKKAPVARWGSPVPVELPCGCGGAVCPGTVSLLPGRIRRAEWRNKSGEVFRSLKCVAYYRHYVTRDLSITKVTENQPYEAWSLDAIRAIMRKLKFSEAEITSFLKDRSLAKGRREGPTKKGVRYATKVAKRALEHLLEHAKRCEIQPDLARRTIFELLMGEHGCEREETLPNGHKAKVSDPEQGHLLVYHPDGSKRAARDPEYNRGWQKIKRALSTARDKKLVDGSERLDFLL